MSPVSSRFSLSLQPSPGPEGGGGGGGRLPYKMDEDARQKFWRKPLKETNLGVAQPQPSFNP